MVHLALDEGGRSPRQLVVAATGLGNPRDAWLNRAITFAVRETNN